MNTKYETLFQTSKTEKQSQYEKIELLQNENNSKEKLIMTLNHSKDQLETTL
jgi:endo-1,4-beta-mannosidase